MPLMWITVLDTLRLTTPWWIELREEFWQFQTSDPNQYSETEQQVLSVFAEHEINEQFTQKFQINRARIPTTSLIRTMAYWVFKRQPWMASSLGRRRATPIYDLRWPGINLDPLDLTSAGNAAADVQNYQDRSQQFNYDLLTTARKGT